MLQPRVGADLALEALHAERSAQRGVQHLERYPAAVPEVLGQVHGRAAPSAQLLLDQVVLGELRREEIVAVRGAAGILHGRLNLGPLPRGFGAAAA